MVFQRHPKHKGLIIQIVPKVYLFYDLDLEVLILTRLSFNLFFFLQFNFYCKTTIKFLMKNARKKHKIVPKRVFEINSINKINLERRRKFNIEF